MIQVKKLYKCQKAIRIKKERPKEGALDPNFSANKNDMLEAMRELSSVGFNLYMYLLSNQDGYVFGLSKVEVIAKTGISERSYTKAVFELEEKGYLVYTQERAFDGVEQAPIYNFFSRPNRMQNLPN